MIEGAFERFSAELVDLGQPTTRAGRMIAQSVIQTMEFVSNRDNNCPTIIAGESFIAGSLGRRTQAQPLDDIDVYLVMDAPTMRAVVAGVALPLLAQFQSIITPLVSDPTLMSNGMISADAVLNRIGAYLSASYPNLESGVRT